MRQLRSAEARLATTGIPTVETPSRNAWRKERSVTLKSSPSPQFPCSSSSVGDSTSGSIIFGDPLDEPIRTARWAAQQGQQASSVIADNNNQSGTVTSLDASNYNSRETIGSPESSNRFDGIFNTNSQFIQSFKWYLRSYGFPIQRLEYSQEQQTRHHEELKPCVPLLSEYPSVVTKSFPLDLRAHLPSRPFAEKLLEVFRQTIQCYSPLFYWPTFIADKFNRAWGEPIWEQDNAVVKSVFCVLQMMFAVASQMVETSELDDSSGGSELQERSILSSEHKNIYFVLSW
jgi:hypothetical protein